MIKSRNKYLYLLVIVVTLGAFYLRYTLFTYKSIDIRAHLLNWYVYIKKYGFWAYGHRFSDYTPAYTYLLGLAVILPIKKLYAIKLISVIFDFISALFVYKLVELRYPQRKIIPVLAYSTFLFIPTVVLNSSSWGQCDIIYTAFIIISLYYLITASNYKQNLVSILLFGIACSFKGLGIFLLPVYIITCIKRGISLWSLLIIPFSYAVSLIPALFAGRGVWDLVTLFSYQINKYDVLAFNAPTIYVFLGKWKWLFIPGVVSALIITSVFMIFVLKHIKKITYNGGLIIKLSLFFSLLVPFILPRMHERYFFLADVLSVIYAFYFSEYFYIPVFIITVSLLNYMHVLFDAPQANPHYLAFAVLLIIIMVFCDLRRTFAVTKGKKTIQ